MKFTVSCFTIFGFSCNADRHSFRGSSPSHRPLLSNKYPPSSRSGHGDSQMRHTMNTPEKKELHTTIWNEKSVRVKERWDEMLLKPGALLASACRVLWAVLSCLLSEALTKNSISKLQRHNHFPLHIKSSLSHRRKSVFMFNISTS